MFPSYYDNVELVLTDFCPFHCKYCFVKNKTPENSTMEMNVIDKTFSLFSHFPRVIFMGGEPLARIDLMDKVVTKYPNFNYQVVTSGLINLDYFVDNIRPKVRVFDFQISWDGFISSRENPEKVWRGIESVLLKGQGVQSRCVISDVNVKEFYNVFNIFLDRHIKYPKFYADFTFAYQEKVGENYANIVESELLKILNKANETDYIFFPQTISRYVDKYLLKDTNTGFCGVGNYVSVRPNGDAYPCTSIAQLDYCKFGNVLHDALDFSVVNSLRCNKLDKCLKCPINYICGGGCRYERILCNNDEWGEKVVDHRCNIMQAIFNAIDCFYKSLSLEDKYKLVNIVTKFHTWETAYLTQDNDSNNLKTKILGR